MAPANPMPQPPEPATWTATVVERRPLAPATVALVLAVDDAAVFRYFAGQYIRIHLADGRQRDLSLAVPWRGDNRCELWLRDVGGDFSRHVFDRLEPGERWRFEGPLGDAWVRPDGRPLLLVSGGTGLGPTRAIVDTVVAAEPERPIELIHGEPEMAGLFLDDYLRRRAAASAAFTYRPVLQRPPADWDGDTGTPDEVVAARYADLSAWSAHLFGPPPMVDALVPVLRARGLPRAQTHADAFTPGATDLDRGQPPG